MCGDVSTKKQGDRLNVEVDKVGLFDYYIKIERQLIVVLLTKCLCGGLLLD